MFDNFDFSVSEESYSSVESRNDYLVDGDLAKEYLAILTDPDQSVETFLTAASNNLVAATAESVIAEKDFMSRENKLILIQKINNDSSISSESAQDLVRAVEAEDSDGFLKKAWTALKNIIRKLIIAVGNFLRSVANFVKGAACKAQAYFFKSDFKGVKTKAKASAKTVNMKAMSATQVFKDLSPNKLIGEALVMAQLFRQGVDTALKAIDTVQNQVTNANGKPMTDAQKTAGQSRITKGLFNEINKAFASAFAKMPGFDNKGSSNGIAFPQVRAFVNKVEYGTEKPAKHPVKYSTLIENYGDTFLADSFIAAVNQAANEAKTSNKTTTKILNNVAKAEAKLLKLADKKTEAKDIMRAYSKVKDAMQFTTAMIITIYGDVLSMRFRIYSIARKLVKGGGKNKKGEPTEKQVANATT